MTHWGSATEHFVGRVGHLAGLGERIEQGTVDISSRIKRRGYDISFRFNDINLISPKTCPGLYSISLDGHYVNIRFDSDAVSDLVEEAIKLPTRRPTSRMSYAVEHTGLLPVYPLNMATCRSTIIGDIIARAVASNGGKASPRYYLDDRCRHLNLVGLRHTKYPNIKLDHAIGRAFAEGLAESKGTETARAERLAQIVFPKTTGSDAALIARDYCSGLDAWKTGVSQTLDAMGVLPQHFDLESEHTSVDAVKRIYSLLVEHSEPPPHVLRPIYTNGTIPYIYRSAVYYAGLLARFDNIISVVSARQRAHIESAKYFATTIVGAEPSRIQFVYFDGVLSNGLHDSVADGRFVSIDSVIAKLQAKFGASQRGAADLLRLCIASHASHRPIHISGDVANSVKSTVGIAALRHAQSSDLRLSREHRSGTYVPGLATTILGTCDAQSTLLDALDPHPLAEKFIALLGLLSQDVNTGNRELRDIGRQQIIAAGEILGLQQIHIRSVRF
jgi:arginyl-tRNA synthetase